jgi:indole-3-glycerol phosphate synthase
MEDILTAIVRNKRQEVERQKEAVKLQTLLGMAAERMERPVVSMSQSLKEKRPGVIAEFKRRSPSKGDIGPEAKVEDIIPAYEKAGAGACSILTDKQFFGGSFTDLQKVRSLTSIPLLRKDFIIDEYQIYQSRAMGADAILLIAACLEKEECERFAQLAHSLGLEVLLEIHTTEELSYVNEHVDMLGVNNRNLGTFHTDIANSYSLAENIKQILKERGLTPLLVSESGIKSSEDIKRLQTAGFEAFLVGETLMRKQAKGETISCSNF